MSKRTSVIIVLIIIGILFYWFEIRPANIRKICGEQALMFGQNYDAPKYKAVYEGCLHEEGLN